MAHPGAVEAHNWAAEDNIHFVNTMKNQKKNAEALCKHYSHHFIKKWVNKLPF